MKRKDKAVSPFKSATHVEHARPMFELMWGPLMGVISTIFEECTADSYPHQEENLPNEAPLGDTNLQIIDLCLMGFDRSIQVACAFRLTTERDAFVASLGKLTGLSDLVGLKTKNVAVVRMLIHTGHLYGNTLEDSWRYILQVRSAVFDCVYFCSA
jgi:brefeldin A-inhibited guanine nucleotide-exchange protein